RPGVSSGLDHTLRRRGKAGCRYAAGPARGEVVCMLQARRRKSAWGRGITVLLLACLGAAACVRTPPEQALRETVREAVDAIESRDASALADHLAADFVGPGGLDRDGARRLAAL